MELTPTKFAFIDFDGLVRIANFFRAALSAEHHPVSDCVITEAMFMLDVVGRFATQDVVCV
jgi:hypothetical protein